MAELIVNFFRHGLTDRNVSGRMCGVTDALVCQEGWDELRRLKAEYEYPTVQKVFSSPAIRCRETASVLFPGQEPKIVNNFWEMDFGIGEDAYVDDHTRLPDFEKWLRQDPDCGFPEGESILECQFRALAAMTRVIKECREEGLSEVAVVAHGEVLGLLLDAALVTEEPREAFLLCPNGMGYSVTIDMDKWFFQEQKMYFKGFLPEGAKRPKPEDSPFFSAQGE